MKKITLTFAAVSMFFLAQAQEKENDTLKIKWRFGYLMLKNLLLK